MKLGGREAIRFFANPDKGCPALLIYGADSMRVALRRQQVITALAGENAAEEMRLMRVNGSDIRKDPAQITDGLKAQGFFPGPRVLFIDEAKDAATEALTTALSEWKPGDATLVVTAGQLAKRSSLRKLFEGHARAYAAAIYQDPPSREEIESLLSKAGIGQVDHGAMADLTALAQAIDPGDLAQTIEKISLYKLGDDTPVTSADIAASAPTTSEAGLDDALNLIAEAKVGEIGPLMHRLEGQGVNPTSICIGANRHFRILHRAASHPKGPEAGLMAARPPVFGPRRDRMARQARNLGVHKIENMLDIIMNADLALRSARPVPARAMLERAFIRIAMLAKT